jgi:hypothetical protein
MQEEFEKKLNQLFQDEMIDKTVHDFCVKKSKMLTLEAEAANNPISNKNQGTGTNSTWENNGEAEETIPNQNDSSDTAKTITARLVQMDAKMSERKAHKREPGKCVCGKAVTSMSSAIICTNEVNALIVF